MTITEYLHSCRKLARFCSQNGWIDNESLHFEIVEQEDRAVITAVEFEEIIMDGAGNIAQRVPCLGWLRLLLDDDGEVQGSELL